ncbi:MAG: hypothetical protein M3O15_01585 [Acidobacteriota bacterium]|nr:hypothetical protein [Acidobacteriota bacterium]
MPGYDESIPPVPPTPPPLDLSRYSEATRRALYDLTVAVHFPTWEVLDDDGEWRAYYTAEDAGLVVFHFASRWFASWEMVEERGNPNLPADRKREVLNITADPEAPQGVRFHEV